MNEKATYFVKRITHFVAPLPGEPDPCGVEVHAWSDELGRHALAGCLHLSTAIDLHGECLVFERINRRP